MLLYKWYPKRSASAILIKKKESKNSAPIEQTKKNQTENRLNLLACDNKNVIVCY